MDTSNRQKGDEKGDSSIIELTDNVAMITGQARMEYNKLTPGEWVAIIKTALIFAKPYLKYVPAFLPVDKIDINYFRMTRDNSHRPDHLGLRMEKTVIRTHCGSYIPGTLAFFINKEKAVQICEVTHPVALDIETSAKLILTDEGKIAFIKCSHGVLGHSFDGDAFMEDIEWLDDDEKLEKYFSIYTQIAPLTLFVISYLLNETYRNKIDQLRNLGAAGTTVESFLSRIEFGDGITLIRPWGWSGGSKK